MLHVLAAAHQEAPRRLGSKHVDDGGFVGMHLRAMPMSVICTIKPQVRVRVRVLTLTLTLTLTLALTLTLTLTSCAPSSSTHSTTSRLALG